MYTKFVLNVLRIWRVHNFGISCNSATYDRNLGKCLHTKILDAYAAVSVILYQILYYLIPSKDKNRCPFDLFVYTSMYITLSTSQVSNGTYQPLSLGHVLSHFHSHCVWKCVLSRFHSHCVWKSLIATRFGSNFIPLP